MLQKDGSKTEEEWSITLAVARTQGDAPLPDYMVTAQTLYLRIMSACSGGTEMDRQLDLKTINCPEDISFEAFKDVYMMAWDEGCKGHHLSAQRDGFGARRG